METYVVRVYRHLDEDGQEILGMVEIVGEDDKKSFSSMHELVEILSAKPPPPPLSSRKYRRKTD